MPPQQDALLEIAEAAGAATDMTDFYAQIHHDRSAD